MFEKFKASPQDLTFGFLKEDHPYFFVLSFIAIVHMVRIKTENMQISILKFFHCVFNAFN